MDVIICQRTSLDNKAKICELIGEIFFYGGFKAETCAEKELKSLLETEGYFFETEDELLNKIGKREYGRKTRYQMLKDSKK